MHHDVLSGLNALMEKLGGLQGKFDDFENERLVLLRKCKRENKKIDLTSHA